MQRFRGAQYAADGAIRNDQLTPDGRHCHSADAEAWHIVLLGESGEVFACSRCVARRGLVPFQSLGLAHSALAICDKWGRKFRMEVERGVAEAARQGYGSGELGGWAVSPELRCSTEVLRNALSMWALLGLLSIRFSFTTATRRHCSASILRRIGGNPFVVDGEEIPHYYDPQYGCDMEALHFEVPGPRFEPWVRDLQRLLATSPVVCAAASCDENPDMTGLSRAPGINLMVHA